MLAHAGVDKDIVNKLEETSFYENILDMVKARYAVKDFNAKLPRPLPGIASLFTSNLDDRTNWANNPDLYQMQRKRAYFYLNKSDYVRAVSLGFEAFISRIMLSENKKANVTSFIVEKYEDRNYVKKAMDDNTINISNKDEYHLLRQLRNSFVHSNRSDKQKVKKILKNKDILKSKLKIFLTNYYLLDLNKNLNFSLKSKFLSRLYQ